MSTEPAPPELSLVFPAHDEEANLPALLDAAVAVGERCVASFEVVVVDDGSSDATAQRVRERARDDPRVGLVQHEANRGYGAALRSGLRAARGAFVFFSDADRQFDLDEITLLLDRRDEADVVAGYRVTRRDPWPRRVLASIGSALARRALGVPVRDVNCAFKLFRREVLDSMELHSNGASINAEILARAVRDGRRIVEVPVHHRPRMAGRQSGASPRVLGRLAIESLRLWRSLRDRRPHSR